METLTLEYPEQVKEIRVEIFKLAKTAPDLETMHWYTSLDEGFENNELQVDELDDIKWRATVLSWKHEPIERLLWLIDACVKSHGYDLCLV